MVGIIDTVLLETLLRLKQAMRWILNKLPSYFLLTASKEIHEKYRIRFFEEEMAARVQTLHTRYLTFKEVLAQPGAHKDFPTKSVITSEKAWQRLCRKKPFVGAYYHDEELLYSKLACLFGMDDVKLEDDKEVIVLSDTSEKLSCEEASCYEVCEGMEEVNSPVVIPPITSRRKLFAKKEEPEDRESTTEMGTYFIDVAPNGQLQTKMERGR